MAFIQQGCTCTGSSSWLPLLNFLYFYFFRKPSRKNSDYFKQIKYWGTSWKDSKDTKLCFIFRIARTFPIQSFWNIHLVWNDRQAYGCYACNWDLLCWAPYKFSIYSNFCMLSLTIYSIDMKKRKAPSWKKKMKTECVFWITWRAVRYLIYSYFTYLWRKKNEVPENV